MARENFSEGEIVWAKLGDFPYWPSKIASEAVGNELREFKEEAGVAVLFLGKQLTFGLVNEKNVKSFKENLDQFKNAKGSQDEQEDFEEALKMAKNGAKFAEPPLELFEEDRPVKKQKRQYNKKNVSVEEDLSEVEEAAESKKPAVEQIKVEEVAVPEAKIEEVKVPEVKGEEAKAEENKVPVVESETKVEEVKVEQVAVLEVKVPVVESETKVEEVKVAESLVEETKPQEVDHDINSSSQIEEMAQPEIIAESKKQDEVSMNPCETVVKNEKVEEVNVANTDAAKVE